jgi:hypothetical protein
MEVEGAPPHPSVCKCKEVQSEATKVLGCEATSWAAKQPPGLRSNLLGCEATAKQPPGLRSNLLGCEATSTAQGLVGHPFLHWSAMHRQGRPTSPCIACVEAHHKAWGPDCIATQCKGGPQTTLGCLWAAPMLTRPVKGGLTPARSYPTAIMRAKKKDQVVAIPPNR